MRTFPLVESICDPAGLYRRLEHDALIMSSLDKEISYACFSDGKWDERVRRNTLLN